MPADLDDRLNDALGRLAPDTDAEAALRSVEARLPRYRARRRARTVGGASLLAGIGLAVGLAVTVPSTPRVTTASSPTATGRLPAVRSCVLVQVGSGVARCAGEPEVGSPPGFGMANRSAAVAAPEKQVAAPKVVPVRAGAPFRVILPRLTGGTWTAVTLERTGTAPPPARAVPFELVEPTGQTIVEVGRLRAGTYLLTALGSSRCPPGAFCTPMGSIRSWQVKLNVRAS